MLIVALQDDVGHYAIWDTNDKKFLGVNLTVHGAIAKILDNSLFYTYEEAIEKLEQAQPFSEIAAHISAGNFSDEEKTLKKRYMIWKKLLIRNWVDGLKIENMVYH